MSIKELCALAWRLGRDHRDSSPNRMEWKVYFAWEDGVRNFAEFDHRACARAFRLGYYERDTEYNEGRA